MTGILQRLLVATDGSPSGDRAVAFAIALARRRGSEILLCSAVDHAAAIAQSSTTIGGFAGLPLVAALDDAVAAIVASAAKNVKNANIPVTTLILEGRAAHAIVTCASDRHVDAIVIGTQGKNGLERFFLGSTAQGVLRRTDVPTFVVSPSTPIHDVDFERILVAVDDSDPSDAAVSFAIDLARLSASTLVLCAAIETADLLEQAAANGYDRMSMLEEFRAAVQSLLDRHATRARARGVAVEIVLAEGDPIATILRAATTHRAGLIVVGTHGRRGLRRFFLGSVAEGVVRQSHVPVAVLRASHLRAAMDVAP